VIGAPSDQQLMSVRGDCFGQLLHPKRSIRMPLVRLQFALVFSPSGGQIQAPSFF
jgi:hypothetical protein